MLKKCSAIKLNCCELLELLDLEVGHTSEKVMSSMHPEDGYAKPLQHHDGPCDVSKATSWLLETITFAVRFKVWARVRERC